MRFVIFSILGLFLWAGTVSIKYPQQPSTVTASQKPACQGDSEGDLLLAQLQKGTVTNIYDNGQMLTIGLPSNWIELSPGLKQEAYDAIACYAQSQRRLFQLLVSEDL
ncbi:MAG: hypothetical protein OEZ57_09730 [Nitrospirota bacterium]|nr:hypothetical protein [Nitrospirota bacterium]MDH5775178.1 hypothetical protein [Nitrospirota bacterium]